MRGVATGGTGASPSIERQKGKRGSSEEGKGDDTTPPKPSS